MADLGTIAFMTLEPGNGTAEEQISFTGVTQNANGTATLTTVKSVTFGTPYTQTAGLMKTHAGSTIAILSNTSGFYQQFLSISGNQTIAGIITFTQPPISATNPTGSTQVANKAYVDATVTAGAPDASTTVKGISKLDTAPASPTNPIAVGINSLLVAPATGTSGGILGWTSSTVRASSVLLTANALILGGGAGATPVPMASLGTTTTVLHGNAAGAPTFGAVSLTADVSGILPAANGGTGASSLPFSGLFKNGTATKAIGDASTTQNIAHGLGQVPKYVRLTGFGGVSGAAIWFQAQSVYNGTTQSSVSAVSNGSASSISTSFILSDGNGNQQTGVITFDGTNIIITWTHANAGSSTSTILWEAWS